MSFLPSTPVFLQDGLTVEEKNNVLEKLKKLKGVAGAHFKDAVKKESIELSCLGDIEAIEKKAKKVPGVKQVGYTL